MTGTSARCGAAGRPLRFRDRRKRPSGKGNYYIWCCKNPHITKYGISGMKIRPFNQMGRKKHRYFVAFDEKIKNI